jgi:tetratricopeptide (TPR) repeat protein
VHSPHPLPETLDRLLAGALGAAEAREVIAHLARRCELCWRHLRGFVGVAAGEDLDDDSRALAMSANLVAGGQAAARVEELEAMSLWTVLERTPPGRRRQLVASDRRFHNRHLVLRMLAEAGERAWRDPGRAVELCRLGLAIVEELLPRAAYPSGLVHDLYAQTLGTLADSLRLAGEVGAAGEVLGRAWGALEEGTCDPLERARLVRREADLKLSLGEFAAAARRLRSAAATYRQYGERHEEARAQQRLALALGHEDPAAGVAAAERALMLIDPGREPQLELAARHALIWFLNDGGHGWRALGLLERSRPLYRQVAENRPRLTLPWLEARICRGLGDLPAAERGLAAVWHEYRGAGFDQELTLVSLDLAEAYLAQGKRRHAERLVRSFHAILRQWRLHGEGLAAWLLLVEAAGGGGDRAQALTREMARYFRRAWRRPHAFSSPG